jgi:hypothetical protein
MFAADGELLYIGCTANLTRRMKNHPDWLLARTRITAEWHPDRATGRAAETRAIKAEAPALNLRSHPDWRTRRGEENWYQSQVNRVTSSNLFCVPTHRKRKRRPTSTQAYIAMLHRMIARYGDRIGDDPETGLAALRQIEQTLTDSANTGIYAAHLDGHSYAELATLLGVTKPAIIKRAKLGADVLRERERATARTARISMRVAQPRELPSPPTS